MLAPDAFDFKKFIYLVQGKASNLKKFEELYKEDSDLILLSYDEEIRPISGFVDTVFYPDSTWAEGRNYLLHLALKKSPDYKYFIFLDDDVEVIKGSFSLFENLLWKYKPMMGVPLCDEIKNSNRYRKDLLVHHPKAFDQVVQAYHADVVKDKIAIPYVTDLDAESWWYACQINQYLTLSYYRGKCAQFNEFEVRNSGHHWMETSDSKSLYRSGVTNTGLDRCRDFILNQFGEQSKVVNSLFHPKWLPREKYPPSVNSFLKNRKMLTRNQMIAEMLWAVRALPSKIFYFAIRKVNVIRYSEFKA